MTFILFVLIFGAVVISHEFGHFIVAKVNGIHVVEFAIGMGPDLFSFKRGNTKYSLKLLPIGGACMFEGEDGLKAAEGEESEGSFNKANVWARIGTVVAGPFFNFILGGLVALIMVGMMNIALPVVDVQENSAAYEAGLQDGDVITELNGDRIYLFGEISLFNQVNGGREVTITYERQGQEYETSLTPRYDEEYGTHMIGIACAEFAQPKGLERVEHAWYQVRFSAIQTYESLKMLLRGQVSREDVSGPVGIAVNVIGKNYDAAKEYGVAAVVGTMLNITLILSINLGILNLLPVPALDGGRLVFLLLEVLRGKPLPPEKEGVVHFAGFVLLMGLMVFVFFNDLINIFNF